MFDFGIADLMLLGPADREVYLLEFRCRRAVLVARGHMIRRTGGFQACVRARLGRLLGPARRLQESRGAAPMIYGTPATT
jgi:hypothetical protein